MAAMDDALAVRIAASGSRCRAARGDLVHLVRAPATRADRAWMESGTANGHTAHLRRHRALPAFNANV
jgi:hypothetical protein